MGSFSLVNLDRYQHSLWSGPLKIVHQSADIRQYLWL